MRWNARIRSLWPVIRVALALSFGALALVLVLGTIGWPAGDVRDADHFQFWAGSRALLEGASPYDLAEYGYSPIRIETPAGRAEYVRQQQQLADRAAPLRDTLAEKCRELLGY